MNDDKQLMDYVFEKHPFRIVDRDGNLWFIATDACEILGLTQVTRALNSLKECEKMIVNINDFGLNTLTTSKGIQKERGNPNINIINEPGLYRLIFQSRKPEAEAFKRWVFHEVLPEIRKKGYYAISELRQENEKLKLLLNRETPRVIGLRECDIWVAQHYASGDKMSHIFLETEYAKFCNSFVNNFHVTKYEFLSAILQRFPDAKTRKITANSMAIHRIYEYY